MKNLNGGYSMIDLTSSTLVNDLANAYALGKPVLAYDSNGKGNFYVLKSNSGAYTLVGADTTYNITSQGVVTSEATLTDFYKHTIGIDNTQVKVYFTITNNTPEYTNKHELVTYLRTRLLNETRCISAVGIDKTNSLSINGVFTNLKPTFTDKTQFIVITGIDNGDFKKLTLDEVNVDDISVSSNKM